MAIFLLPPPPLPLRPRPQIFNIDIQSHSWSHSCAKRTCHPSRTRYKQHSQYTDTDTWESRYGVRKCRSDVKAREQILLVSCMFVRRFLFPPSLFLSHALAPNRLNCTKQRNPLQTSCTSIACPNLELGGHCRAALGCNVQM